MSTSPEALRLEHFTLDLQFDTKSAGEVEYEGQTGVMVQGYATRFGEYDQVGEITDPHAYDHAARTFFDTSTGNGPVPILFHHGFDPVMSTRRIGRVVDYQIDKIGVAVKAFIPKPEEGEDPVLRKARDIYDAIRSGVINGFSMGGAFGKMGRDIKSVGLYEISITPIPCLDSARFAVCQKSLPIIDAHDDAGALQVEVTTAPIAPEEAQAFGLFQKLIQSITTKAAPAKDADDKPQNPPPSYQLSRTAHGKALAIAQKERHAPLHDHLLDHNHYPPEAQGEHSPDQCAVCAGRRDMMGTKSAPDASPDESVVTTPADSSDTSPAAPETGEAAGAGDAAITPPTEDLSVAVSVKTLSPDSLPTRLLELATVAYDLSTLHTQLSALDERIGQPDVAATVIDAKAGKTLSGISLQTLRQFATQVVAAGQELHSWLDAHAPGLNDPVVDAAKQGALQAAAQAPKPAAAAKPAASSSSKPTPSKA